MDMYQKRKMRQEKKNNQQNNEVEKSVSTGKEQLI